VLADATDPHIVGRLRSVPVAARQGPTGRETGSDDQKTDCYSPGAKTGKRAVGARIRKRRDTNGPELSTPGRAEAHQSGTCTCPETSHTSVAAADLGRRTSVGRATTRDPGTGSSRRPDHHGRCR
jgi:hypothetical protein